jgi:glycosyltransferase involved in cell wall biosynthesis
VVATTVGDIPLILDDGRAGVLVPPHDPRGLADAIGKLVANPEERERLGRLGRERVEQVFRSDRVMRALFDAYVSVTSTPPA